MAATNIKEAFHDILINNGTFAAITTKVFPNEVNQTETMPYSVYLVSDVFANQSKDTVSKLDELDFLLIHKAETFAQCDSMAMAARNALEKYNGTVGSVIIQDIIFEGENSFFDEFHYIQQEFKVFQTK